MRDMRDIDADRIGALIIIVTSLLKTLGQIPGGLHAVNEAKENALEVAKISDKLGGGEIVNFVRTFTSDVI